MSEERISIREFSRRIGCSDVAVHKAIKSGKIVHGVGRDDDDKPYILPDVAASEWGKSFNPSYANNDKLHESLSFASKSEVPADRVEIPEPKQAQPEITDGAKSIVELKRLDLHVRVQLAALDLRKRKGELVEKNKVYSELFSLGQEIRTVFAAIPDRVIDSLMASKDRNEAHAILSKEIFECLTQVSEITQRGQNW